MALVALIVMTPLPQAGADDLTNSNSKQSLAIFQNYMRLKNGIAPSPNSELKKEALQNYRLAFDNARDANTAIATRAEANCQRFVKVYNSVGEQTSFYYGKFIDGENELPKQILKLIEARLRILDFFEQALFSLVFLNAEAGTSVLDPGAKATCATTERKVWTGILLSAHEKLRLLHDSTLGEPGALYDETEAWKQLDSEYSWRRTRDRLAWLAGETMASIILWDKTAGKLINGLSNISFVSRSVWAGRIVKFLTGSAYISSWVAFDRYMRTQLPFLMDAPQFHGQEPMAGWDDLMSTGEEFLVSNLASPPLYFAYVELLSVTRKRAIFEFLRDHQWSLLQAEHEYGSIENAIEKLKEVTHDQDKISNPSYRVNSHINMLTNRVRGNA